MITINRRFVPDSIAGSAWILEDSMRRWLGVVSVLGGITALPLMVAFMATGFGEPGTAAYQTYELLNRLMAISLEMSDQGC